MIYHCVIERHLNTDEPHKLMGRRAYFQFHRKKVDSKEIPIDPRHQGDLPCTLAFDWIKEEKSLGLSMAVCGFSDNFVRQTGRNKAIGRFDQLVCALNGLSEKVPIILDEHPDGKDVYLNLPTLDDYGIYRESLVEMLMQFLFEKGVIWLKKQKEFQVKQK